mmetsp:Transcript_65499/g.158454  ORF Transcript_65499/g.158454 Transcript_65499/m.158454 type:complete len:216 (-) Transcript_65499:1025-1672(-)
MSKLNNQRVTESWRGKKTDGRERTRVKGTQTTEASRIMLSGGVKSCGRTKEGRTASWDAWTGTDSGRSRRASRERSKSCGKKNGGVQRRKRGKAVWQRRLRKNARGSKRCGRRRRGSACKRSRRPSLQDSRNCKSSNGRQKLKLSGGREQKKRQRPRLSVGGELKMRQRPRPRLMSCAFGRSPSGRQCLQRRPARCRVCSRLWHSTSSSCSRQSA